MSSEKAFGAPLDAPLEINEPFTRNIGLCMTEKSRKIHESRIQELLSVVVSRSQKISMTRNLKLPVSRASFATSALRFAQPPDYFERKVFYRAGTILLLRLWITLCHL